MAQRFLVIGDPHFKLDNAFATHQLQQVVLAHLVNNSYTAVVVLGDILDRHEQVDLRPLKRATDFLVALSQQITTYCLIGNHDRINNTDYLSPYHPLVGLEHWPNLHIVATPLQVGAIGFIPYVPNNMFGTALATLPDVDNIKLYFAHQEIKGAQLGAIVSAIDETWPLTSPPVISGHIHEYQEVQPNWIYVGTPFAHAFGDSNDKSLSVITLDATEWSHQRLYLELPGKVLEHLTTSQVAARLDNQWQPLAHMSYKFKITGQRSDIQRLKQHPQYGQLATAGVKLVFEYTDSAPPTVKSLVYRSYTNIILDRLQKHPLALAYFEGLLRDVV